MEMVDPVMAGQFAVKDLIQVLHFMPYFDIFECELYIHDVFPWFYYVYRLQP